MLAGLIRSPNYLSPFNQFEAANQSKNRILERVAEEGWVPRDQLEQLRDMPVVLVDESAHRGQPIYLLNRVREEVKRIVGDEPIGVATVRTSINLDLQRACEVALVDGIARVNRSEGMRAVRQPVARGEKGLHKTDGLQGASLVVEQSTGRIISAVPSRDQIESHYDRIRLSKRPPGFAFAPLVYAAAYEAGIANPESPVFDVPMDNRLVMLGGTEGILGEWSGGSRHSRYLGRIPSGLALVAGKQSATVRVGFDLGLEKLGEVAKSMGVESRLKPYPSSFLGATEISLEELVHAYTSISNPGDRVRELTLVDAILDRKGKPVFLRTTESREKVRAISGDTSQSLRRLLYEALDERLAESETLRGARPGEFGITGTSHNFEDNWAVGGNNDFTWGVWLGLDKPGRIYDEAHARGTTLPVWMGMADALGEVSAGRMRQKQEAVERERIAPKEEIQEADVPADPGLDWTIPPPIQWRPPAWTNRSVTPAGEAPRSVTPAVAPVEGEDAWLVLGEDK